MEKVKNNMINAKQAKAACVKSVLAGVLIGISGTVYLSLDNKLAGAFLFSFGLLTIVTQGLNLFTGLVGYISDMEKLAVSLITIVGNFAGVYLVAGLDHLAGLSVTSAEICQQKLSLSLPMILARAVCCGILMFLAVDGYKKKQQAIYIVLPVMIFILAGFDHSIANMFYFSLENAWNAETGIRMIVMLLGNAAGALFFRILKDYAEK